ncbi:hypothetical protein K470DRAFT_209619, partial [Piedraia hortae CBS 480.64]
HVGVHCPALAEEYGLPVNLDTFQGEDAQRLNKQWIQYSNHGSPDFYLLIKGNRRFVE